MVHGEPRIEASRSFTIGVARFPADAPRLDALFREYAASLGFSLCFQGFDRELTDLAARYGPPRGVALIAADASGDAGCIALKDLEGGVCEMKRLYVRPGHRGRGLGRTLAQRLIAEARSLGYSRMRLDTIAETMRAAVALYRSLGFVEIEPYTANPVPGALFMELRLHGSS